MLNQTVMTGRLVNDPELRFTKNDVPVASFRIAVRRDYVKEGDIDTDFFDIVAWRKTAEFISQYFQKGSLIQVVGQLHNRHWKDKHEQPRISTELTVDKAYFGDSKGKNGDNGNPAGDSELSEGASYLPNEPNPFEDRGGIADDVDPFA